MITVEALRAVGASRQKAAELLEPLKAACAFYGIDTPKRICAFLAQYGHESEGFLYATELWGPTPAQKRYEGRIDLGNTQPGDGSKFRGHSYGQVTGRANHARVRDRLRARFPGVPDFEENPEELAKLPWAILAACDYWDDHHCNNYADADDFVGLTRAINGGENGLADRKLRWQRVKAVVLPDVPIQDFAVTEEKTMLPLAPILLQFLPTMLEAIPELAKKFSSGSPTAERNIEAAKVVFDIAKDAIGARNEQEVIETMQSDPDALEAVRSAIKDNWYKLEEVGGGIGAAREANLKVQGDRGFQHNPAVWFSALLLVFPFMLLVDLFWVHPDSYDANLRTQIVTAILAIIMMVGAYWLGTVANARQQTGVKA